MAGLFQNIFGGASPSPAPAAEDSDFADFAGAPDPSPPSITADGATPITSSAFATNAAGVPVPYTKWYRVWERTSPQDFYQEAFVLPFIFLIFAFHLWGTRTNKRKAKVWVQAHAPSLQNEFAVVGFEGIPRESEQALVDPQTLLKEKTAQEFATYATGRQNVAFVDITIHLLKRYNPVVYVMDYIMSLFFESWAVPVEKFEAIAYTFDGKEKDLVPAPAGDKDALEHKTKGSNSTYEPFVWAVVHKNSMRKLREERYDASLTFTKDSAKLPTWATVMSESAEITDILLTPALIKAVEQAGDALEFLLISDQPVDKPTKIEETVPKKRLHLSIRVPSSNSATAYTSTLPLFNYFIRLPDQLASLGKLRPEVMRKIRNTRDEEIKRLKRADDEEKAEERKLAAEKIKKEERERLLRGMSAEEQRKFLDREREREQKRGMKKQTRRA